MAHGGRNGLCRRLTSSDLQRCRHHERVENAACLHKQQQPTPLLKRREGGSAREVFTGGSDIANSSQCVSRIQALTRRPTHFFSFSSPFPGRTSQHASS